MCHNNPGWQDVSAVKPTILEKLHRVLLNYHNYLNRLDKLQHTLDNLVKPASVTNFKYIDVM